MTGWLYMMGLEKLVGPANFTLSPVCGVGFALVKFPKKWQPHRLDENIALGEGVLMSLEEQGMFEYLIKTFLHHLHYSTSFSLSDKTISRRKCNSCTWLACPVNQWNDIPSPIKTKIFQSGPLFCCTNGNTTDIKCSYSMWNGRKYTIETPHHSGLNTTPPTFDWMFPIKRFVHPVSHTLCAWGK